MPLMPHFFDLDRDDLRQWVAAQGMPAYRAEQLLEWVYGRHVVDPRQMTNISKRERETLAETMAWRRGTAVRHQRATDGVQKLLIDWREQASPSLTVLDNPQTQTECVMIPAVSEAERERRTACISSQIGCAVGCRFCASGLGGLDGDLTAGQIVEQVWQLAALPGIERISHIVFMGMGEPLANFTEVVRAVRTLTADWATGISARRITISTVGLPAQIRRLAAIELPVTLAISLHAPNDELRRSLIPWAEYVSIDQLVDAGRDYFDRTGREITLEYILLREVNDRIDHARELAQVARRLRSNVNLIRYNEVRGMPYDRPRSEDVHVFQAELRRAGVNAHIRASRGRDIAAACGQLRHERATT